MPPQRDCRFPEMGNSPSNDKREIREFHSISDMKVGEIIPSENRPNRSQSSSSFLSDYTVVSTRTGIEEGKPIKNTEGRIVGHLIAYEPRNRNLSDSDVLDMNMTKSRGSASVATAASNSAPNIRERVLLKVPKKLNPSRLRAFSSRTSSFAKSPQPSAIQTANADESILPRITTEYGGGYFEALEAMVIPKHPEPSLLSPHSTSDLVSMDFNNDALEGSEELDVSQNLYSIASSASSSSASVHLETPTSTPRDSNRRRLEMLRQRTVPSAASLGNKVALLAAKLNGKMTSPDSPNEGNSSDKVDSLSTRLDHYKPRSLDVDIPSPPNPIPTVKLSSACRNTTSPVQDDKNEILEDLAHSVSHLSQPEMMDLIETTSDMSQASADQPMKLFADYAKRDPSVPLSEGSDNKIVQYAHSKESKVELTRGFLESLGQALHNQIGGVAALYAKSLGQPSSRFGRVVTALIK